MQWLALLISGVSLVLAIGAITVSRSFHRDVQGLSARLATLTGELSHFEAAERLTPSRLAELAAVNDAIQKGNDLLKRVNSREVMRARRTNGDHDPNETKDDLRRRAGLVAGRPAPHR